MTFPFTLKAKAGKTKCIRGETTRLERRQLGAYGEDVVAEVYGGERQTTESGDYNSPIDVLTDKEGLEVKTFHIDNKDKKLRMTDKAMRSKIKWCRKRNVKPKSVMVITNGWTEVYERDGFGSWRMENMTLKTRFKKGQIVPLGKVEKPAELFDISGYSDDFAKIKWTDALKQAQYSDITALIESDLRTIAVGKERFVSLAEGIPFQKKMAPVIRQNMSHELRRYKSYLTKEVYKEAEDFVSDLTKLLEKGTFGSMDGGVLNQMGTDSIKKLIMQEMESNRQQFTDHGVRHLLGNVKRQQGILDLLKKQGFTVTDMDRLQGMFIMINHDIGYATPLVRSGGLRGVMASGKHKIFSNKILSQQTQKWDVGKVFTQKEYNRIMKITYTHDLPDLDLSDPLAFATRVADNTSLWASEKLPSMFKYVNGAEQVLVDLGQASKAGNIALFEKKREEMNSLIDATKGFSPQLKRDLKSAVKEISNVSPKFTMGALGGEMTSMYSTSKSMLVMDVEHSQWDQFLSRFFDMGQSQVKKLMKDYGAPFKDNVLFLGQHKGKNILEVRITKSPMPVLNPEVKTVFAEEKSPFVAHQISGKNYEEKVAKVEELLGETLKETSVWTRQREAVFDKILADGRIKTQFEAGTSSGLLDPEKRQRIEDIVVGVSDVAKINRPVYGYLTDNKGGWGAREKGADSLRQYGNIAIKLKPRVKGFTTFTVGDSLDTNNYVIDDIIEAERPDWKKSAIKRLATVGSPVDAPRYYSVNNPEFVNETLDALQNKDFKELQGIYGYIEAQIHGGVTLEDIDEIVFHGPAVAEKYGPKLDKLKIKWRLDTTPPKKETTRPRRGSEDWD